MKYKVSSVFSNYFRNFIFRNQPTGVLEKQKHVNIVIFFKSKYSTIH